MAVIKIYVPAKTQARLFTENQIDWTKPVSLYNASGSDKNIDIANREIQQMESKGFSGYSQIWLTETAYIYSFPIWVIGTALSTSNEYGDIFP